MRRFINGKFEGTGLEIMPSKAATTLPDGTPIRPINPEATISATQWLAKTGEIDVHARQVYSDLDRDGNWCWFEGPTIAQQWKNEYNAKRTQRGWRARYYNAGPVELYPMEDE
jgi:hypothetical protein